MLGDENFEDRNVVNLTIGERIYFTGIILPIISIIPPRYIIISTSIPKIKVDIGESTEKPSNENCVIKIVAEMANTDGRRPLINLPLIFEVFFGMASMISEDIITPKVAKAESHKEISKIE